MTVAAADNVNRVVADLKNKLDGKQHDAGYVYSPYVPLMSIGDIQGAARVTEFIEETVQELPPSDEDSIQVGEGSGPLIERKVIVEVSEQNFTPRPGILERYAQKVVDPTLYGKITLNEP